MINEKKLKEYVKDKCYEWLAVRGLARSKKDEMLRNSLGIMDDDDDFWIGTAYKSAVEMTKEYERFKQLNTDLSQLAHMLGGEYLEMYENVIKK